MKITPYTKRSLSIILFRHVLGATLLMTQIIIPTQSANSLYVLDELFFFFCCCFFFIYSWLFVFTSFSPLLRSSIPWTCWLIYLKCRVCMYICIYNGVRTIAPLLGLGIALGLALKLGLAGGIFLGGNCPRTIYSYQSIHVVWSKLLGA